MKIKKRNGSFFVGVGVLNIVKTTNRRKYVILTLISDRNVVYRVK